MLRFYYCHKQTLPWTRGKMSNKAMLQVFANFIICISGQEEYGFPHPPSNTNVNLFEKYYRRKTFFKLKKL